MNFLDTNPESSSLRAEEERILAAFTRRLLAISAVTNGPGAAFHQTAALNAMHVAALTLDEAGCVVDLNAAARAILDNSITIKDKRIFFRDAESRARLREALESLRETPQLNPLIADPIIVPRKDKLPVILRIWPCACDAQASPEAARFVVTLNALGPKPGPQAPFLVKIFGFTASEARLACVMARGTPCNVAAQELNISRETARNQLKSIFAKTDTHRQTALVALLSQIE